MIHIYCKRKIPLCLKHKRKIQLGLSLIISNHTKSLKKQRSKIANQVLMLGDNMSIALSDTRSHGTQNRQLI